MEKKEKITTDFVLSTLGHTWILDLDGTVVKHNGYKLDGEDEFLEGAKEFLLGLPEKDMIVFLTSRTMDVKEQTETFLRGNGIRFSQIVYGAPYGERILINDDKPSGLCMAHCVNSSRNQWCGVQYTEDKTL